MALVHNMLIRAYNSIYLQATHVRPADVPDFLNYCSAWHMTLKGHHDAEEEVYFPGIEKATGVKGIMDSEVHEHGQQPPKFLHPLTCVKICLCYFEQPSNDLLADS